MLTWSSQRLCPCDQLRSKYTTHTLTIFSKCSLRAARHRDIMFLPSAAGTSLPVALPCCSRTGMQVAAGVHGCPRTSFAALNLMKGKCKLSYFLKPRAHFVLWTQLLVPHRQLPPRPSSSSGAKIRTLFHLNAEADVA